jgi:hypothetical protein
MLVARSLDPIDLPKFSWLTANFAGEEGFQFGD